jgi:uncharacterized YigZ family protein
LQTIEQAGAAEQTINKSRFYAHVAHCESEQAVGAFLRAIAAQHPSAHHLAYAFRIKTPDGLRNHMIVSRFSDAGEPSGTAGKPILQMLEGRDLINVCVGVIRYYGGVNLGTGGLARAYGGTAKIALEAASTLPFVEMQLLKLTIQYNRMDELTRTLTQLKGKILNKTFDDAVHVEISLPAIEINAFKNRFS